MNPQVVVLGGAAVDLVARVEELPQRDSLVLARSFERFPGGSAANVAVGLARMGQRVGFVGKMGDDEQGRLLMEAFEQEGVDTRGAIVETGRPTATCFIAVDDRGERIIVALPGVAVIEKIEELDLDYMRGARAVYIGPSYPEVATTTAAAVRESGGTVFCAPGGVHVPVGILAPVLERTAVLLVSRTEALALAGQTSPDEAARTLREMGPQVVVETLGPEGVLVVSGAGLTHVPSFDIPDAQDTTGAGDGFAAGLIAGFLEGLDWAAAARMGCAVAALKIRHVGARSGLPGREEVQSLLGVPLRSKHCWARGRTAIIRSTVSPLKSQGEMNMNWIKKLKTNLAVKLHQEQHERERGREKLATLQKEEQERLAKFSKICAPLSRAVERTLAGIKKEGLVVEGPSMTWARVKRFERYWITRFEEHHRARSDNDYDYDIYSAYAIEWKVRPGSRSERLGDDTIGYCDVLITVDNSTLKPFFIFRRSLVKPKYVEGTSEPELQNAFGPFLEDYLRSVWQESLPSTTRA